MSAEQDMRLVRYKMNADLTLGNLGREGVDYELFPVWYEGVYGTPGRFVVCRRNRFGVWCNDKTGTYMVEPRIDGNGRWNGSL